MKDMGMTGFIGRFKPLHNGAAAALEILCEKSDYLVIGIGSSNKYNARNPFTADESEDMINAVLAPNFNNYQILQIPDSGHIAEYADGNRWKKTVIEKFGSLDYFITGNGYVADLLADRYKIIHPGLLIPKEKQVMLKAAKVRVELAKGEDWQQYVPRQVVKYIQENRLDQRFRREFGLEILANLADNYWLNETTEQEKAHTLVE